MRVSDSCKHSVTAVAQPPAPPSPSRAFSPTGCREPRPIPETVGRVGLHWAHGEGLTCADLTQIPGSIAGGWGDREETEERKHSQLPVSCVPHPIPGHRATDWQVGAFFTRVS